EEAAMPTLLTAEEFARRPDPGYPEELVRGKILRLTYATPRHGRICSEENLLIGRYLDDHDLGHLINQAGLITGRDPDTVRGPDIALYSYQRVARGPMPNDYGTEPPELIVEVKSHSDRWPTMLAR